MIFQDGSIIISLILVTVQNNLFFMNDFIYFKIVINLSIFLTYMFELNHFDMVKYPVTDMFRLIFNVHVRI